MASPIGFKELCKLTNSGVDAKNIKYDNVTLNSDRFVVVNQQTSVSIVDTSSGKLLSLPISVNSAIMNPVAKIVALSAKPQNGQTGLQIYHLETKSGLKNASVQGTIAYWRWVDPKTIVLVNEKSVFRWSMDGNSAPVKVFDRAETPNPVKILQFRQSADSKWMLLNGMQMSQQGVQGFLQVYSVDNKVSQPTIPSTAACFLSITLPNRSAPSTLFCFVRSQGDQHMLVYTEVGVPSNQAFRKNISINLAQGDIALSLLPDDKHGMCFLITKGGSLFLFDLPEGKQIFGEKASQSAMFASIECTNDNAGGVMAVDQTGRVSKFFVDSNNIVGYITNKLGDVGFAAKLAARCNFAGGQEMFTQQFQNLVQQQNWQAAMQLAASSPQGCLRTLNTINAFRAVEGGRGLLTYFQLLLQKGSLNAIESVELVKPIIQKNTPQGMEQLKKWIQEKRLEPTEELGDLLKNTDVKFALAIYLNAKIHDKVISCFLSLGAQERDENAALENFKRVIAYSKQSNFTPDYPVLVSQLVRVNLDRAKDLAILLLQHEEGPKLEIKQTIGMFLQQGDVKNTTNILLEHLRTRGDLEEDAALQTKLLEINLCGNKPEVADAIMESEDYKLSHYDTLKIAQLCERAGLYQRALEHYTDLMDIKRVLHNAPVLDSKFVIDFFIKMTPPDAIDCLRDLLKNPQKNLRLVVEIATKWADYLTPSAIIALFEETDNFKALYFFLGSFVNQSEDSAVVFKYIEAATRLGQLEEVERICRENDHYEAKEVKEYLLAQNLKYAKPLIHVCDRFGFVDELTQYLYQNNMAQVIDLYVQRMNPNAAPQVVGTLLDLNASDEQIRKLVSGIRPPTESVNFMEEFCGEVEKRNRLKILRTWLEERAQEGNQDPELHNGLAKIYVEINNNPQQFLTSNAYYNSLVVGKYCESRDPHLSFIAYKRAWGECDTELIEVTSKNGYFKDQARYLVEKQDLDLWATVLTDDNEYKRQLIDQVVATALPESRVPEEVSTTVKAFMAANLPNELIELLEKIILHGPQDGEFATNKNLQNLLILTAAKADKKRVMDYVKRLDNYDGPDIAKIAASDNYELYEEAFFIYKKFDREAEAINVLLDNIEDLQRAVEFAEYCDKADVWSILAKAQLNQAQVKEAIKSFLKAEDASVFHNVIVAAKEQGAFEELITFVHMARSKLKDTELDNTLIYCFANTNKLSDLEDFIIGAHNAKIQECGDLLFKEELYQAAKILFTHVNNAAMLACCLVKLEDFQAAVDAARKANVMSTWKQVCFSCVEAQKFRLAQMCALNIIVRIDELHELCRYYERLGHFAELITVLEQGINLDRAHKGIYTQLGICYSRYKEEKLMEHIKYFWSRLNIPTLLQECQKSLHWPEAVYLYSHQDQYDNAIDVMINHSAACWDDKLFKDTIVQVANTEVYYRAIDFYLQEHPLLLNPLLMDLVNKVDHARVVHVLNRAGHVALVERYLRAVQKDDIGAVNECLNELYVAAGDYKSLRASVEAYHTFDQISLAQKLDKHDLVEFRRIASYLYFMNKKYEKSIELSKRDELWQDAMETAAASEDAALVEGLLRFFVENENKPAFTACLYACYAFVRPDVVMELAWRFNLMDFAMPFMVQTMADMSSKLSYVTNKLNEADKAKADAEAEQKKQEDQAQEMGYAMNNLALAPPPGAMQQQYGNNGMQQQQQYGNNGMQLPTQGFY